MCNLDKLGKKIEVGDYIVYPVEVSDSTRLRIGKILSINDAKRLGSCQTCKDNSYTVIGIKDRYNGEKVLQSKGTLKYSDRIIVLPNEMVPQEYKDLLQNV